MTCFKSGTKQMLAGLALSSLLTSGSVLAQQRQGNGDLMEEVKQREQIEAQRTESELREGLRKAEKLAQTDALAATENLRKMIAGLEEDTTLSQNRRESLLNMLRGRIRFWEGTANQAKSVAKQGEHAPVPAQRKVENENERMDRALIQYKLRMIRDLQEKGQIEEARKEVLGLANQFPENEAVRSAKRMILMSEQLKNGRTTRMDREQGLAATSREMTRSSTPPAGDVDFPKDWQERTKGRSSAIQLTAKEKALMQALNTPISVQFKGARLEEVVEYLQTFTGQPIILDREALKEAELNYDTPVTVHLKGITTRNVLRKIFNELGLTYIIKDEMIQVVSASRAREMMVVRRYYVGDLLAGMADTSQLTAPVPTPALTGVTGLPGIPMNSQFQPLNVVPSGSVPTGLQLQVQMIQSAKVLVDMIQTSVDPSSWKSGNGEGTISFHAPSMSLIIKQSAEVHALLGNGGLSK